MTYRYHTIIDRLTPYYNNPDYLNKCAYKKLNKTRHMKVLNTWTVKIEYKYFFIKKYVHKDGSTINGVTRNESRKWVRNVKCRQ